MSFSSSDELVFPPRGLSLHLYELYFFASNWMAATFQSLIVALGTVALSLSLGVTAAYGLTRTDFPGKRLVAMFLLSPAFVPAIVLALGLYLYLGVIHLSGTTLALIISHTLVAIPFVIVTTMAGLRHVDRNLETAATVMGAGRLLVLRRVTLPSSRRPCSPRRYSPSSSPSTRSSSPPSSPACAPKPCPSKCTAPSTGKSPPSSPPSPAC